jgi:hypothetical protein
VGFRSDEGFAISVVLLVLSVATSVIVGGSSTTASIMNHADVHEAAGHMDYVAADIRMRTKGDDSPRAQALREHAGEMNSVTDAMRAAADQDVFINLRNNLGDAVLTPLQNGVGVVDAVKFAWDFKTGWELGDTALKAYDLKDPGADIVIGLLQDLDLDRDYGEPVEQAIIEGKLNGARIAVAQSDPGISDEEIEALAAQLVLEAEQIGTVERPHDDDYSNPYLATVYAGLGWNVPDEAATGGGGAAQPDPATGAAGADLPSADVLTGVTWHVEGVVWETAGLVDPLDAPGQPYSTDDLYAYGNQRMSYAFSADGTLSHRHAFWGDGTYTFDGVTGEITFVGDLPMAGTVLSASFYYDRATDTLYVIEHWFDAWDDAMHDRAIRMKRGT